MIDILWSIISGIFGIHWLLLNSLFFIVIYHLIYKQWSFFSRNNIKFVRGLPIFGAQWRFFFGRKSLPDVVKSIYQKYSNEQIIGMYDIGGTPVYIIRDPELIKQIAIKDFDSFTNHKFFIDTETDPMFGRSLIVMRDQRWKSMRSNLSPAFTGSKMRLMFSLIGDVSNAFSLGLKNELNSNNTIDCDIRELFERFANDAIASCAFGMNINSMTDKTNEFYTTGKSVSNFSGLRNLLKFIVLLACPKIAKYLNVSIFKKKDSIYFRKIVKNNMEYREKNGIIRNDMINLLFQLKKGTLAYGKGENDDDSDIGFAMVQESTIGKAPITHVGNWEDDDLIAQCMIFFLGGFSTVSLTLSFLAHDLAVHPIIQAKIYEEIQETQEKLNGQPLTYDALQKMKYLDMVLSESMRKWPQVAASDRIVNKQCEMEITDGKKIILNPGDIVMFPVFGLHRDEKYFPNPDQFDPERFSDENKENILTGTYMPFGIGPRNCIASRFALMECKACIFNLLSNYRLEMCEKTQNPMKLKANSGNMEGEMGFWVKIVLRE